MESDAVCWRDDTVFHMPAMFRAFARGGKGRVCSLPRCTVHFPAGVPAAVYHLQFPLCPCPPGSTYPLGKCWDGSGRSGPLQLDLTCYRIGESTTLCSATRCDSTKKSTPSSTDSHNISSLTLKGKKCTSGQADQLSRNILMLELILCFRSKTRQLHADKTVSPFLSLL